MNIFHFRAPVERLVIRIWSIIWRKWLIDYRGERAKVVRVKGWRTAIVDYKNSSRRTISPCFTIFGIKFD